jgi:hypothetical protein
MIYTDGIHLVGDTLDELHEFAGKIGLSNKWFEDHNHQYYPLFGNKVERAIAGGAKFKDTRYLVRLKQENDQRKAMKITYQ